MGRIEAVRVSTRVGEGYRIRIGDGALARLPRILSALGPERRVAVVGDSRALRIHRERLAAHLPARVVFMELPEGEHNKTRAEKERIEDELIARRFGRDSVLVGFGGGVATDLAGFVAATYLRGIPFVGVPTTLLAAVDASVGGKTGVNTPLGKNLIGVFRQPAAVVVDTALLGTLSDAEFRNGLAESVKMAATSDPDLFHDLERAGEALLRRDPVELVSLIRRSVSVKARIVEEDEREAGPREVLNFGHTVGHAIENATGYRMRHGFAVAVGMAAESRMAEHAGHLAAAAGDRLRALLGVLGLPVRMEEPALRDRILTAFGTDKKARGGVARFVVLTGIGCIRQEGRRCAFPLDDETVRHGLDRIGLAA